MFPRCPLPSQWSPLELLFIETLSCDECRQLVFCHSGPMYWYLLVTIELELVKWGDWTLNKLTNIFRTFFFFHQNTIYTPSGFSMQIHRWKAVHSKREEIQDLFKYSAGTTNLITLPDSCKQTSTWSTNVVLITVSYGEFWVVRNTFFCVCFVAQSEQTNVEFLNITPCWFKI